jgi:hypothetical protein
MAAAKVTAEDAGAAARAMGKRDMQAGHAEGATQAPRKAKVHSFTLDPTVADALDRVARATGSNHSAIVEAAVLAYARAHSGALGPSLPVGSTHASSRSYEPPASLGDVPGAPGAGKSR